jgi:hypothetical protein
LGLDLANTVKLATTTRARGDWNHKISFLAA